VTLNPLETARALGDAVSQRVKSDAPIDEILKAVSKVRIPVDTRPVSGNADRAADIRDGHEGPEQEARGNSNNGNAEAKEA
jgi:hypothetical protein